MSKQLKEVQNKLRPASRKKLAGKVKAMRKQAKQTGESVHMKITGKLKG